MRSAAAEHQLHPWRTVAVARYNHIPDLRELRAAGVPRQMEASN
ncbi:hypothetical protein N4P33_02815 [Streptomyces sp. 15-116A]|nr:hypothetical protein [Streptomyces sp. 15-116A]MCT7351107.1 hypothetical protein [Streptomyces sp. 15-116A]